MEDNICSNEEEDSIHSEVGNYFFQTQELHDVHFIVGKQQERIPGVRSLLINQSRVWWSMLSKDSPLVEKGDITLPDVEPEIFRLLLKHCYGGLQDCSSLPDEDVVELCRCADKYLMSALKSKIAASLKPSNVDEVFHALHCIAHYNLQADNEAVKRIVQTQTLEIFAHPLFLECDEDSITYITRQDPLACEEIQLWKYVLKWAKNKAGTDDGPKLREWMIGPIRHIRLFTLSNNDLLQHVFTTNILTSSEIASICIKKSAEDKLCRKTKTRQILTQPFTCSHNIVQPSGNFKVDIKHSILVEGKFSFANKTSAYFFVKSENIYLKYITCAGLPECYGNDLNNPYCRQNMFQEKSSANIKITVTRITDLLLNSSDEESTVIELPSFTFHICNRFDFPVNITLQANNKYIFQLEFYPFFPCWRHPQCVKGHEFEHGLFYCSPFYQGGVGTTPCHILGFEYSVDVQD